MFKTFVSLLSGHALWMGVSNYLQFRPPLPSLPGSTSLYPFYSLQDRTDSFGKEKICFLFLGSNSGPSVATPLPHLTPPSTELRFNSYDDPVDVNLRMFPQLFDVLEQFSLIILEWLQQLLQRILSRHELNVFLRNGSLFCILYQLVQSHDRKCHWAKLRSIFKCFSSNLNITVHYHENRLLYKYN